MLTWQDDHWFGKHLQADGTDELLLQTLHEEDSRKICSSRQMKEKKKNNRSWTSEGDTLEMLRLFLAEGTSAVTVTTFPYMSKVTQSPDREKQEWGWGGGP